MNRLITSNSTGLALSVVGATLIIAITFAAVTMDGPAVGEMSGPSISAPTVERSVSVNRVNKGDRLSQGPVDRPSHNSPSTEAVIPLKRVPLGCDPAFSPVADPARANIYKRCMV